MMEGEDVAQGGGGEDGRYEQVHEDESDKDREQELSIGFCLIDNMRVGFRSAVKVRGLQAWR
jgi:hypothetical protein